MKAGTTQLPRIQGSADLETAARFMLFCDTDRVEVVDEGGRSKGIVTERDVIRSIANRGSVRTSIQALLADLNGALDTVPARIPTAGPVAADIMSRSVVACGEEATLQEIAGLLADREVSGIPVVDRADRVVGVISERDLADALGAPLIRLAVGHPMSTGSFLRQPCLDKRAADIMSRPLVVCRPDTPLNEMASRMIDEQVNRLPVVEGDRLAGIVTRGDILSAVAEMGGVLREPPSLPTVVR
jgi:CBS domain-containing protein